MSTWANQTKNSATWSTQNKSDQFGGAGYATGLIAPPTYTETQLATTWANQTKNSASWTNQTKN